MSANKYHKYLRWIIAKIVTVSLVILVVTSTSFGSELKCNKVDVTGFPNIVTGISVIDDQGYAIVGLNRSNFSIYEDEIPILDFELSSAYNELISLSIVLAVDTSGSMRGRSWTYLQEAVYDFLGRLSVTDRIALIVFGESYKLLVPFTTSKDQIGKALSVLSPGGNTALHDAIAASIELHNDSIASRRAIILFTDGQDTSSKNKPDQILSRLRSNEIPIYIIGLGRKVNASLLSSYANTSDGGYFSAASPDELMQIYGKIAGRLQNQYFIKYKSRSKIDEWHNLRVFAKFESHELTASRPFLTNPDPLNSITVQKSRFSGSFLAFILIGGAVGIFLASIFAVIFRLRGIGTIRHRIIIICLGILLGGCAGILYGFWVSNL